MIKSLETKEELAGLNFKSTMSGNPEDIRLIDSEATIEIAALLTQMGSDHPDNNNTWIKEEYMKLVHGSEAKVDSGMFGYYFRAFLRNIRK